jgi:hypothetical protein
MQLKWKRMLILFLIAFAVWYVAISIGPARDKYDPAYYDASHLKIDGSMFGFKKH